MADQDPTTRLQHFNGKRMLSDIQRAHWAIMQACKVKEVCISCGNKIQVMCMRGTNVCSEQCRNDRDSSHGKRGVALTNAPDGGER